MLIQKHEIIINKPQVLVILEWIKAINKITIHEVFSKFIVRKSEKHVSEVF